MERSTRRAVLVTYSDPFLRQEARSLAEAAGFHVSAEVKAGSLSSSKFGVGPGKAEEIRLLVENSASEAVLVDEHLRTVQIYNLAKHCRSEVLDREKLILEIFRSRAATAEANLQVKLAELRYEVPRARERVRLAKVGEQPGFYGLGKYEVDTYYRAIKRQISTLTEKLRKIRSHRALHRVQRRRLGLPMISLAGYTGAGKTTLFNRLAEETRAVSGDVFTTLATTVRSFDLCGEKALISDTVGFIMRLPPYMIEAFHSTLEELTYADLVLLVLDASEPEKDMRRKYLSCVDILADLGVPPDRVLAVFNKADLAPLDTLNEKKQLYPQLWGAAVVIAAKTGEGVDLLNETIMSLLETKIVRSGQEEPREIPARSSALPTPFDPDDLGLLKDG